MNPINHESDEGRRPFDLQTWIRVLAISRPLAPYAVGLAIIAASIAACEVALPYLTGRIVDEVTTVGMGAGFVRLATLYVICLLVLAAAICIYILLAGRIATGSNHLIRTKSFAKLQELSFSFYDTNGVGWLISRLTSDSERLARIIGWILLDFLWGGSMLVGIVAVMFWLDARLASVVLSLLPVLLAVSGLFQRLLLRTSRLIRKANAVLMAQINEGIMGVRTTKALVREEANLKEFTSSADAMYNHSVRHALQSALYVPLMISIGSVMAGLALWAGGSRWLGGSITLGVLVTFLNYAGQLLDPIQQMARQMTEVLMAQAAAERIVTLLETEAEIHDSPKVVSRIAQHAEAGLKSNLAVDGLPSRIETIEFRNVGFAYVANEPVIEQMNLTVHAGETIALVGPTGGGKSTLVALLARFYEPDRGEILIDDIDYRERSLAWWQSQLGIVMQTPFLFSGTIRDNICYGDLEANDADIAEAARLAGADSVANQFRDGFDAEVGEGGSRLSTGQRQLVALARAILADPQVMILDEATSSVDTETEHKIQRGIDRLLGHRTSFVIAHRLSTVRASSRILFIDQGRIVEQGTHAELVSRRGRYYQLSLPQLSSR